MLGPSRRLKKVTIPGRCGGVDGSRLASCRAAWRWWPGRTATAGLGILVTFSVFLGRAPAQSAEYRLRISDRIGQKSSYRLAFEMRMRADYVGAGEVEGSARQLVDALAAGISARTVVEYEQRLTAVEWDGARAFEVRWRDYQFSGRIGEVEVSPPVGYAVMMREMYRQTARVRLTPTGQTIDVLYSQPRLAGLAGQFRQMLGAMPTHLPERAVSTGDSWTSTVRFPLGPEGSGAGSMTLELDHTLEEIRAGPEGPIAVIQLAGSYSQLQDTGDVTLGVPMHVEASLTGSTLFDVNRGRYTGGRYEIDMFALHAAEGVEVQLTGHADGNLELLSSR